MNDKETNLEQVIFSFEALEAEQRKQNNELIYDLRLFRRVARAERRWYVGRAEKAEAENIRLREACQMFVDNSERDLHMQSVYPSGGIHRARTLAVIALKKYSGQREIEDEQ